MLLAYSSDPEFHQSLRRASPSGIAVVQQWHLLEKRMSGASCLIAHFQLLDADLRDRFSLLRSRFKHVPVVAVVERIPEVALFFRDIVLEELVWTDEIRQQLETAIAHALSRSLSRRIIIEVRKADQLTPLTREFITLVLQKQRPYRTVRGVARALQVDAKTIHNHWSGSGIMGSDLSPKDFIDWVLLLRAASLRSAGRAWNEIGQLLSTHPRTLQHLAERLLHNALPRTEASAFATAAFCRTALPLLVGADFPDFDSISAFFHYDS